MSAITDHYVIPSSLFVFMILIISSNDMFRNCHLTKNLLGEQQFLHKILVYHLTATAILVGCLVGAFLEIPPPCVVLISTACLFVNNGQGKVYYIKLIRISCEIY